MSLWIRSQDKENLINVNKIEITDFCDAYKSTIWGDDILLGKYSSKEKALKVLDMIQECIEYNNSSHNSQWDSTPYRVYNVFQMPLDSEVEE